MAAGAAAPEALVLADLLIGLAAIVVAVILMGMLWTYRNTFGWLIQQVAGFEVRIPVIGAHIHPLSVLGTVNDAFVAALSDAAAASQGAAGRFFHAAAIVQGWIVREFKDYALEAWSWANWLQKSHLPKWIKALIYAALPPLVLPRILKELGRINLPALWKELRSIEARLQRGVVHIVKVAGPAAIPGAWELPGIIKKVRELWDDRKIGLRLPRHLRWIAAIGSVTALGLTILERLGLKWLKCKNVNQVGKAICKSDLSLLESLLTDGLVVASLVSVVEFAHGLLAIEDEAIGVLGKLVREWPKA